MLSRYEKRRLREIEEWFVKDDPRFAEQVRAGVPEARGGTPVRVLHALIPVGGVVVLVGLVTALPVVVFIGICCAVGGLALGHWLRCRQGSGPR